MLLVINQSINHSFIHSFVHSEGILMAHMTAERSWLLEMEWIKNGINKTVNTLKLMYRIAPINVSHILFSSLTYRRKSGACVRVKAEIRATSRRWLLLLLPPLEMQAGWDWTGRGKDDISWWTQNAVQHCVRLVIFMAFACRVNVYMVSVHTSST